MLMKKNYEISVMKSAANNRSNNTFYVSIFFKRLLDNFFITTFQKRGKASVHRE